MPRIYPNWDGGRNTEMQERSHAHRPREVNCEQIFQRAPNVTKDILGRMQNTHIGKTYICGYGFKTKQLWVLAGLVLLFSSSTAGTILLWFTDVFDSMILSSLVLSNGTDAFKFWARPTFKTQIKIYLYNYTNVDEYEKGVDPKLKVQDVGPYVYEETKQRVNIHFKEGGMLSYQDNLSYQFLPRLSKGKQSDRVIVPNLMVIAASERTKSSFLITKIATSFTLGGVMKKKPFMKLAAHRYIWGYEDSVFQLARGIMSFQDPYMNRAIGLFAHRNGTVPNLITINTGEQNINEIGLVKNIDGNDRIGHWSTDDCDRISGSDGSFFPPKAIREKEDVNVYYRDMCRKLPFVFSEEIKMLKGTVPAYRYVLPEDVFANADHDVENQCYCDLNSGVCPPHGFFNVSPCAYGAPIFVSLPHFYNADPAYINVLGVNSTPRDALNYFDIHPVMGYPMSGNIKMQVNIFAKKSYGFSSMDMFDEDLMLPVAWFEAGVTEEELPQEVIDLIYKSTFTVHGFELTFKYGTLLTAIVTLIAILIILRAKWLAHTERSGRNSSL